MEHALLSISYIGAILLAGLLSSMISRKLQIPNLLLLILLGMGLSLIKVDGKILMQFPPVFLTSIAILTLAMVVFDSSSKFKFKKFDSISAQAMKLSLVFLLLNMVFLSGLVFYLLKPDSFFLALIFAAVVSGTDPSATLQILGSAKSKMFELLKVEAILNTPLIVLIPFLIIDLMQGVSGFGFDIIASQAIPFAQQFVTGIGTGILIAIIFFRFMKKHYSATLSPLAMLTAALLTYVIAETLGGNGVLAVTTAGIIFGNVYHVKHMKKLLEFGEEFALILEIIVFVLIGSIISIPFTKAFLIPATVIFLVYLVIRLLSVEISFPHEFAFKEKLYMSLNIPKGIAVAVVIFTLATQSIPGMGMILDLILLFMIYSIVLSTIITHFTKFFTKIDIKIKKEQ